MAMTDNTLLKFLSLGLLVPHTIIYTLLAAVARKPDAQGHVFFGPSAVALMEFGKMLISVIGVMHHTATSSANGAQQGESKPASASAAAAAAAQAGQDDYVAVRMHRHSSSVNIALLEPNSHDSDNMTRRSSTSDKGDDQEEYTQFLASQQQQQQEQERDLQFNSNNTSLNGKLRSIWRGAKEEILNPNGLRLIAPALLYVCQNNLQVFSAGSLTPAEYQIVGQTKLAFTAVFSVLILKRKLNWKHWTSIATLAIGTIVVQTISVNEVRKESATASIAAETSEAATAGGAAGGAAVGKAAPGRTQFDLLLGTAAMLGASACSGLGGVLVEALLKKKMHFWTTNVHLAFFSLLPACIPIAVDAFVHASFNPLRWFTATVWSLIGFNILGGIIASMTMKYADNILKNFAVAISLIGTVYLSALVSGIPVTIAQFCGTALVVCAIAGYARA